jgi:tRNA-uridine 2-sulfurtransferase
MITKEKSKVLCALSGGIDSSVAALLLKRQGYQVYGLTFKFFKTTKKDFLNRACAVCQKLDIPHYVLDLSKKFKKEIIENFISEYRAGRTPNPCVRCNQLIKFPALISYAKKLGIHYVATGHYARLEREIPSSKKQITNKLQKTNSKQITYKLLKAKDKTKDQSYFLWALTQSQLRHILFPVSDYRKIEVRKLAKEERLPVIEQESHDICFLKSKSIYEFLSSKIKAEASPIIDINSKKVVGEDSGLPFYTIGQRKGLGGGYKKPMFVVKIDVKNNTVIVGQEKDLYSEKCKVKNVNFISNKSLKLSMKIKARVRYNMQGKEATLQEKNGKYILIFKEPQRAITPGQSAVFYKGDEVLGGGTINE